MEPTEAAYRDAVALVGPGMRLPDRSMLASCARDRGDIGTVIRALDGCVDTGALTAELVWLSDAHASELPARPRNLRFYERLQRGVRRHPSIARGYATVLVTGGRFRHAERVLRRLLEGSPSDTYLLLKLVEALRRDDREAEVGLFVAGCAETGLTGPPGHRVGWAHQLRMAGEGARALALGYDLVRAFPNDPKVALGYVGLVLGLPNGSDAIPEHHRVDRGCWVAIENDRGERDALIVDEGPALLGIDVVPEGDDRARNVIGLGLGGTFDVVRVITGAETWAVKEIKSKYLQVLHVLMGTFGRRFPSAQGLTRFTVPEGDIQPFLKLVKEDAEARREYVERTYVKGGLPLAFVATAARQNPLGMANYVRDLGFDILTSDGTLADRELGISNAREYRGAGAVLDTDTAVVAAEVGMLPFLRAWFGSLRVARSTMDEIQGMVATLAEGLGRGISTVDYVDGQSVRQDVTDDFIEHQVALLESIRERVASECVVEAALLPDSASGEVADFTRKVGRHAIDPMLLAAHHAEILVSDDLPYRRVVAGLTSADGTWLQAVTLAARGEGAATGAVLTLSLPCRARIVDVNLCDPLGCWNPQARPRGDPECPMPRTTSTDKRWLEFHGKRWRVTVAVPKALRPVLGTRLKRDLRTDSLAVANRLKLQVVAELQHRIDAARQDHLGRPNNVIREAVEIARTAGRARGPYEWAEIEACIRERAETSWETRSATAPSWMTMAVTRRCRSTTPGGSGSRGSSWTWPGERSSRSRRCTGTTCRGPRSSAGPRPTTSARSAT